MGTLTPATTVVKKPFAIPTASAFTSGSATFAMPHPKIDTQDPAWIPGRYLAAVTTWLIVGVTALEGNVNTSWKVCDVLGA
jgi:hypothetical protein